MASREGVDKGCLDLIGFLRVSLDVPNSQLAERRQQESPAPNDSRRALRPGQEPQSASDCEPAFGPEVRRKSEGVGTKI